MSEKFFRQLSIEVSIYRRKKCEVTVRKPVDERCIDLIKLSFTKLPQVLRRGDVPTGHKRCRGEDTIEGIFLLKVCSDRDVGGTLYDRSLEWGWSGPTVCRELSQDAAATGGLAQDCDSIRVAAEEVDVVLDPFESECLVLKPKIRGCVLLIRGA